MNYMSNNRNLAENPKLTPKKESIELNNALNFEFKYKNNQFFTNRLFNRIEKLSFDIPKDEKITTMFCDLHWNSPRMFFMYFLFPIFISIAILLPFSIESVISIITIFILPISLLLSYFILCLITKTRSFKILLFTDRSINLIHLLRKNSTHTYLHYNKVLKLSIKRNEITIFDKSDINNIEFSMYYNKNTFFRIVKEIIYNQLDEDILIEYETNQIKELKGRGTRIKKK